MPDLTPAQRALLEMVPEEWGEILGANYPNEEARKMGKMGLIQIRPNVRWWWSWRLAPKKEGGDEH